MTASLTAEATSNKKFRESIFAEETRRAGNALARRRASFAGTADALEADLDAAVFRFAADLALDFVLILLLVFDFALALAADLDLTLAFDFDLTRALALVFVLVRTLAFDLALDFAFDFGRAFALDLSLVTDFFFAEVRLREDLAFTARRSDFLRAGERFVRELFGFLAILVWELTNSCVSLQQLRESARLLLNLSERYAYIVTMGIPTPSTRTTIDGLPKKRNDLHQSCCDPLRVSE